MYLLESLYLYILSKLYWVIYRDQRTELNIAKKEYCTMNVGEDVCSFTSSLYTYTVYTDGWITKPTKKYVYRVTVSVNGGKRIGGWYSTILSCLFNENKLPCKTSDECALSAY